MKQVLQNMNGQTRSLALACGGAVLAAAFTMFLPVSVLEGITGSTGLSELVPATAAPLGDTARALIAFGTGVMAFAILAIFLSKKNGSAAKAAVDSAVMPNEASVEARDEKPEGASLIGLLRDKASALITRARGEGKIKDLADLPKLRNRDIHPDAPARQPISAHRDFGAFHDNAMQLDEVALPQASANARSPYVMPTAAPEVVEVPEVFEQAAPVAEATQLPVAEIAAPIFEASLAQTEPEPEPANLTQMVDQLEAMLASRQAQLQQLEDIAQRAAAQSEARNIVLPEVQPDFAGPQSEAVADKHADEPTVERRLEAVETTGAAINRARNGDDALRSALETLHRMNARSN